jgi:intracellular septation protein
VSQPSKQTHAAVRAVVDYGGLALFVLAYFAKLRFVAAPASALHWTIAIGGAGPRDLTGATWWLVIGSALGLLVGLIVERRLAPMPMIAGGFALVFGTLTLVFHNPEFIKIKPTASNLVFAIALFGGLWLKRNPLGWLLGDAIPLPDEAWRKLTLRYALFFLSMAIVNEIVRRTQSNDVWVLFRMPGLLLLALAFSATQVPFMMKYLHSSEAPPPPTE